MGIIKDKLNKQIQANNLRRYSDTTGTILNYDPITNRAKISFNSPIGEGIMIRENVPISSQSGGFTQSGIHIGAKCNIAFYSNNIYSPVITGINNSFYNDKTCSDQGACLVDESINAVTKPEGIIPMCSQWIDVNNQNRTKYSNDIGDYQKSDITIETMDILNRLDKYETDEEGVTNLKTKSTIKLKENGDIDIFVANNIGIRISKINKQIFLYGDLFINGEKYESVDKQDSDAIMN